MPALTLRRSSHSSREHPKLSKGAVIGGSIGGVYVVICVVVLILLIRRRKKQRRAVRDKQLENLSAANQSSVYVEYHDHLNGKSPPPRSLVVSPSTYRPPTRRNQHGRTSSEGTVMRGGASDPFWMFGGIYEETEGDLTPGRRRAHSSPHHSHSNSSPRHRRSNSSPRHRYSNSNPHHQYSDSNPQNRFSTSSHFNRYSTSTHQRHRSNSSPRRHQRTESDYSMRASESFEIRPATAISMQMHMPTSIFVTEMNARFPDAALKSQAGSQIRQVPCSPSPSSSIFREIVDGQEDGPIPPIAIVPLMRRSSIDRIVSGAREKSTEREKEGPELIRVGTLPKGEKRKIVHVARNKSVEGLSERILSRVRKSRKGVLEDV